MKSDFEFDDAAEMLLRKFHGPMTVEEIAVGIELCLHNAKELYLDAIALSESGRHGRTMSLLIASMEEVGKTVVLSSMVRIPQKNAGMWNDAWKAFRCHKTKSTYAFAQTFDDELRSVPEAFAERVNFQATLAPLAERLRQVGLYVDYLGKDGWMSPIGVAESDAAKWFPRVESALSRLLEFESLGVYSPQILRIQHEIFAPLNEGRPRSKDMSQHDIENLLKAYESARIVFVKRLIAEGILDPDSDIKYMGLSLHEFVNQ